jgi:methionyl-tRNA synthetase
MKRKTTPPAEPVIDQAFLEQAKRSVMGDQVKRLDKCSVCGAGCAPNSTENLCWVCRRLKISAWRDSDQQSVQE